MDLARELHNIWATNQVMIGAVQELLDFSDKVAELSGYVVRIAEFDEVMDDLAAIKQGSNTKTADQEEVHRGQCCDTDIEFERRILNLKPYTLNVEL